MPTRLSKHKGSLIDQAFCRYNDHSEFNSAGLFISDLSDHLPYFVSLNIMAKAKRKPDFVKIYKHNEASYNAFTNETKTLLNRSNISNNIFDDPTDNCSKLEFAMTDARDKHLKPTIVRFRKYKHKICPWMTKGILNSISVRDTLYKQLKLIPPDSQEYNSAETNFKSYRSILQRSIRLAKKYYYIELFDKMQYDIRKTWASINTVLGKGKNKLKFPEYFNINGKNVRDPSVISAQFNDFFANIGNNLSKSIAYNGSKNVTTFLKQSVLSSFHFSLVEHTDVMKTIMELAPKSSCGRDGISTKMLRQIADVIIIPVTIIINQSLSTGIFPDRLKIARVIPLFKKDDVHILGNYRPISLLPCLSKILEKVVFIQVYKYFVDNNLFYDSQYGFRKRHSTELASLELVDRIYNSLDQGKAAISVFLDLSKAFDTLDHAILFQKLSFYGIGGTALNWFKSYLHNRFQYVDYNGHCSDLLPLTTGVPQGSILGPLLFIIYINDINYACNHFKAIIYADDTNLFSSICSFATTVDSSQRSLSDAINKELAHIQEWLNINKLSLNVKKTKFMVFHHRQRRLNNDPVHLTLNGQPIERVRSFNFLGLNLDEHMNWNTHIQVTANKIARTIGVINRLKHYLPLEVLRYLYNALILPYFQYSVLTWGFKQNRLNKLQKRAVRVVSRSKYNAHTEPLFKKLNLLKLDDIFKLNILKTFFNYTNETLPKYFSDMFSAVQARHGYNTRTHGHLQVTYARTASCQDCIRHFLPRFINDTDDNIISKAFSHSYQGFSKYAKRSMLNAYSSSCEIPNCYICNHQ